MYTRAVARRICKLCLRLRHIQFDIIFIALLMLAGLFLLYTYSLSSTQPNDKLIAGKWDWQEFEQVRDATDTELEKTPEDIQISRERSQAVNLSRLISSSKIGGSKSDVLCQHAHLDLQHDVNRHQYRLLDPLTCRPDNIFHFAHNKLLIYKPSIRRKIKKCLYHGIVRVTDDHVMDTKLHERNHAPFEIELVHDFIHVYCYYKSLTTTTQVPVVKMGEFDKEYVAHEAEDISEFDAEFRPDIDQFLVQIHPSVEVLQRIKVTNIPRTATQMSVLIFCLDSMSHLSYQRNLPKTYAYIHDVLGSVVFKSYNIVGDATTAAILPILTGKMEWELPEARRRITESVYVDEYPLIWKDFRDTGYVTMYSEDEPSLSTFNLRLNGFESQPTDHYMRPFWKRILNSALNEKSSQFCLGGVPKHQYLVNYTHDFFVKYANVPKFAFSFSSQLTHGDNNPGQYIDSDIVHMLESLRSQGLLNSTVVIVMGDHGSRANNVRWTVQGKLEERLPLMSISVPDQFKQLYPRAYRNLVRNSDRLTSPFDIHETLLDLLDTSRWKHKQRSHDTHRGLSLFSKIPTNRTCQDAGIAMHWCTCMKQLPVKRSSQNVIAAVNATIDYINGLISSPKLSRMCATIRLKEIRQAYIIIPNEKVLRFEVSGEDNRDPNFGSSAQVDVVFYQITMETLPNNALYEFTMQVNLISSTYKISGEVSRVNLYGNQADCVVSTFPHLRKYCFCTNTALA